MSAADWLRLAGVVLAVASAFALGWMAGHLRGWMAGYRACMEVVRKHWREDLSL